MVFIPNQIKEIVGNQKYQQNDIGMSGSKVLMYPEYVLKIQQHTAESDNEKNLESWLNGKIPIPKIFVYCVDNGVSYTLMSRVKGEMLCDEKYLNNPKKSIQLAAKGLKMLWSVDVGDCPYHVSHLEERLNAARWNVENDIVDLDNVEADTFGLQGFASPEELIDWLERNRPEEDIVLTHGDFCLPNIFIHNDKISGFIDNGKMGPADRWQDIAIVLRSLEHNFEGKYCDFDPQMLLNELGIEMDIKKNRYYKLLDELF